MAKDVITKIEVPFPTERHADIVYQVMRVDAEPKRSEVKKSLELENKILKVQFTASEVRKVRVAVTSFFESINLITSTLAAFPDPEPKYDFYTNFFNQKQTKMPAPSRSRSIYGYALYIGSNCIFLLYLIWALVPEETLNKYSGMSEWPSKYWAVAIPVWVGTAFAVFAAFIYPAINMSITPGIDDVRTIKDKHSLSYKETVPGGIPVVYDIPITDVCRKLYLKE